MELSQDAKKFNLVYKGDAIEITLQDLCPFTVYYLRVFASLTSQFRGDYTEPVSFQTKACEPDRPAVPKLFARKKNEMTVRWTAANENGSKIVDFVLQYRQVNADEVNSDNYDAENPSSPPFQEIYKGPLKQFIIRKLQPSTYYAFRVAAENSIGRSAFSQPLIACTSGSVPDQPAVPFLLDATISTLTLRWTQVSESFSRNSSTEITYELQKREPDANQGFITVYNGTQLSYTVTELKKASSYEFRVS